MKAATGGFIAGIIYFAAIPTYSLMLSLNIRTAILADAAVITTLSVTTFTETFAHCNSAADMAMYLSTEMNPAKLERELDDNSNTFFIASVDGKDIGFAKVRNSLAPPELEHTHALEIERLYVLRDYHSMKAGAALMTRCLAFAREHNYNTVWLGVWEHNHKAIAFYDRWGFSAFGSHIFMLGIDEQTDVLMSKEIE
ncbi:MAG: GNAT family N-acetyltransferase [Taibaiella sp.]|nr:GNAT family N-acetyltransferase [Taibaiella sp.]